MKQKDIALIIVIGVISAVLSVGLSNILLAPKKNRQQKTEVVELINPEFKLPDSKYFNKDAINPTQRITIGENGNTTPFNEKKN